MANSRLARGAEGHCVLVAPHRIVGWWTAASVHAQTLERKSTTWASLGPCDPEHLRGEFSISPAVSVGATGEGQLDQLSVELIITGTVSFPSRS